MKRCLIGFLLMLLCLLPATRAVADDFEDGRVFANRGEFAEALRIWEPLAKKGDPRAQFSVGRMTMRGEGLARDFAAGRRLFEQAAEQGYAPAFLALGKIYYFGDGVPADGQRAYFYFQEATKRGLGEAGSYLQRLRGRLKGDPVKNSAERSLPHGAIGAAGRQPDLRKADPKRPPPTAFRGDLGWLRVAALLLILYLAAVFLSGIFGKVILFDNLADFGCTLSAAVSIVALAFLWPNAGPNSVLWCAPLVILALLTARRSVSLAVSANGRLGVILFPAKYIFSFLGPAILVGLATMVAERKFNRAKGRGLLLVTAVLGIFSWTLINGERVRAGRIRKSSSGKAGDSGRKSANDDRQEDARREREWQQPGERPAKSRPDPYEIFGLTRTATLPEVEARYRKLVMKYHPDRVNDLGEEFIKMAHEKMIQIQEAYSLLKRGAS